MASVDRGQSVEMTPAQRGGRSTPAYNTGQPTLKATIADELEPRPTRRSMTGGLNGAPTLDHTHPDRASVPAVPGIGNQSGSIPGVFRYYKMRGYYATGAAYETWVAIGAPSSSPPSGHTLTNVQVVGSF